MPAPVDINYYEVLDVPDTADNDEIKRAFRRLSLARHPNKDPDNPKAHTAFCILKEAYETLSDPSKRAVYDLQYANRKARQRNVQQPRTQIPARQVQPTARPSDAEILRKLNLEHAAGNVKRVVEEKQEQEKIRRIRKDRDTARSQLGGVEEERQERIANYHSIGIREFLVSWTKSNEELENEKDERDREDLQRMTSECTKIRFLEGKIKELVRDEESQLRIMQESETRNNQRLKRFRHARQAARAHVEAGAKKAANC